MKSPLESLNYLLDILSPGSQQTEIHATRDDLVDNPFMRPEDTKMVANICSFERMEATMNEFQPFKAPGPDGLYPVLSQKCWNQLKGGAWYGMENGMEGKFRYEIWKMPEWNGRFQEWNGRQSSILPYQFHTRFRAFFCRKILTDVG